MKATTNSGLANGSGAEMRRKANVDGTHLHVEIMGSERAEKDDIGSEGRLPLVVAIVLNFNDRQTTLKCVSSVLSSSYPDLALIVVDNSSDESLMTELKSLEDRCTYRATGENLGYAGGNNVGIEMALSMGADYVLVLNNDTTVDGKAVESLVRAAEESEHRIGALFPKVLQDDGPSAGGRLRWDGWTDHIMDDGNLPVNRSGLFGPIDWVPGIAIFFPRKSLEDVGPFNHRLFFYYEDVEWSLRARAKGYLLFCCPHALVLHEHSKTFDRSSAEFRTYYPIRNEVATALTWFPIGMRYLALIRILLSLAVDSFDHILNRRSRLIKVMVEAVADGLLGRLGRKYVPMED